MSEVVITPPPLQHSKCKHFGLSFDQHQSCRKCTIREEGSLHSKNNICSVCMDWSAADWARYNSPLKTSSGANSSTDQAKSKKTKKGRSSKKGTAPAVPLVSGAGENFSVVNVTTTSTAPHGLGKCQKVSETVVTAVNTAGITHGSSGGITSSTTAATGSVVPTTAVDGSVPTVPSPSTVLPPAVMSGGLTAPWLPPLDSSMAGSLPVIPQMLSGLPVTSQSLGISTHGPQGSLVTTSGPVTTVASMGSRPIESIGAVDLGSNQGLPYMYQLIQQVLQGMQGQSTGTALGTAPRLSAASTAAANVVTGQGNYLVHTTGGSIPSTGQSSLGSLSAMAGPLGGPLDPQLVGPPAIPRLPGVESLAGGSQTTRWVHHLKPGQSSSQSAPGVGTISTAPLTLPLPMEVDSESEGACAYSDSDSSLSPSMGLEMPVLSEYSLDQGVRAANVGRIPASKAAQQTAVSSLRANIATAMKYLPQGVLPPTATPAPQKSFTVSANTKQETVAFLQFPPSEGFAKAFNMAQSSIMSRGISLLKGEDRATPKFVRSLAKYLPEKHVSMGNYAPLSNLWYNHLQVPEDLAPLLRLQGKDNLSSPKLQVNQAMFHQLELATRTPLSVLSYMDWFAESTKQCFKSIQQHLSAVDPNLQLDPNFLAASNLCKDLSGLLAQQRDMLEDLLRLQVHSAAQVTTMRRDSYLALINPLVPAKTAVYLRSGNLLGPDLFERDAVTQAVSQFNKLSKAKQRDLMVSSMVSTAKAVNKRHGQSAQQGPRNKKPRTFRGSQAPPQGGAKTQGRQNPKQDFRPAKGKGAKSRHRKGKQSS